MLMCAHLNHAGNEHQLNQLDGPYFTQVVIGDCKYIFLKTDRGNHRAFCLSTIFATIAAGTFLSFYGKITVQTLIAKLYCKQLQPESAHALQYIFCRPFSYSFSILQMDESE